MELSIIVNLTGMLLLTGFFSAFPGLGSGMVIFILGCESIWANYFPNMKLILMFCFIAGGVIRFFINKTERYNDAYPVLLVFFGIGVVLSTLLCINPFDSLNNSSILLLFLMISYQFNCNARYQQRKKWMIRFLLITSLLNCAIIFAQIPWKVLLTVFLFEGWVPTLNLLLIHHSEVFHIVGGFSYPILSGLFLVMVIPLWIQLLIRVKKIPNQGLSVWLIYGALALITLSNLLIFSNIIWITTLIMLIGGWVFYSYPGKLLRFQIYIVPSIMALMGGLTVIVAFYYSIYGMGTGLENRMEKLLYSIYAFTQNPLFGIGYGQLIPYLVWKDLTFQFHDEQSFSSIFLLLAETGLIGTIFLVVLMGYLLDLFQFDSHNRFESTDWVMLGVYSVLGISILVLPAHQYLLFWCILGLVSGSQKPVHEPKPISQPPKVVYKIDQGHR